MAEDHMSIEEIKYYVDPFCTNLSTIFGFDEKFEDLIYEIYEKIKDEYYFLEKVEEEVRKRINDESLVEKLEDAILYLKAGEELEKKVTEFIQKNKHLKPLLYRTTIYDEGNRYESLIFLWDPERDKFYRLYAYIDNKFRPAFYVEEIDKEELERELKDYGYAYEFIYSKFFEDLAKERAIRELTELLEKGEGKFLINLNSGEVISWNYGSNSKPMEWQEDEVVYKELDEEFVQEWEYMDDLARYIVEEEICCFRPKPEYTLDLLDFQK
jgi:hypothetical protein